MKTINIAREHQTSLNINVFLMKLAKLPQDVTQPL